MIFNQGQFMAADYTDDELRAIAASRAAAATASLHANEAQGRQAAAVQEQAQANAMDRASLIASIEQDPRIQKGGNVKWWIYGSAAAGGALLLYLLSKPKRRPHTFHSRPKKK